MEFIDTKFQALTNIMANFIIEAFYITFYGVSVYNVYIFTHCISLIGIKECNLVAI